VLHSRRIHPSFTAEEHAVVVAAASRLGITPSALTAEAVLDAARNLGAPGDSPLRGALLDLMRLAERGRKIGTTLEEIHWRIAESGIAESGTVLEELSAAAAECRRTVRNVDTAARRIQRRIRDGG
jgi:hypothetical protein